MLVEQDVFVGGEAVSETVAAGSGFALGARGPGRFFCILAVRFDLGFRRGAGLIRLFRIICLFHTVVAGAFGPTSPICYRGGFGKYGPDSFKWLKDWVKPVWLGL